MPSGVYERKLIGWFVKCKICNNNIYVTPFKVKIGRKKFCSKKCFTIFLTGRKTGRITKTAIKKGQHLSPKTEFKKGRNLREKSPNWAGGRYKHNLGYYILYCANHPYPQKERYVFEHRLVVEQQINRYLLPSECVHHINRIKDDNRPENLMAFTNHSIHRKFELGSKVNSFDIIFDGRRLKRNLSFSKSSSVQMLLRSK